MTRNFIVCAFLYCVAGSTFSAPIRSMKCIPCELVCRGLEAKSVANCTPTCMCEPNKSDTQEVKQQVLCEFRHCDYYCMMGYKMDNNGCRLCECLKPPDNVS